MDEKTRSELNAGLEGLVFAARKASLTWEEHLALNNVAVRLKKLIDGKESENEGTSDGRAAGGE